MTVDVDGNWKRTFALKPETAWNFDGGVDWYPSTRVAASVTELGGKAMLDWAGGLVWALAPSADKVWVLSLIGQLDRNLRGRHP